MTAKSPPAASKLAGYANEPVPLSAYAILMALHAVWTCGLLAAEPSRKRPLAKRGLGELLLLGLATHKISRLIAKDRVTSPLRAPFTRLVESAGAGEVEEEARGQGMQRAIGEMISCPFCLSPWVALGLATGWTIAPRATRAFCGLMSAVGLAHFLHHRYVALDEKHS